MTNYEPVNISSAQNSLKLHLAAFSEKPFVQRSDMNLHTRFIFEFSSQSDSEAYENFHRETLINILRGDHMPSKLVVTSGMIRIKEDNGAGLHASSFDEYEAQRVSIIKIQTDYAENQASECHYKI